MKKYRILIAIAVSVVLIGLLSRTLLHAAPVEADISLNSVGSRHTNTDIPIKGYLGGNMAGQRLVMVTQRNDNGAWTTLETRTVAELGEVVMAPQQMPTAGTFQFRLQVSAGGVVLDASDPISVKVTDDESALRLVAPVATATDRTVDGAVDCQTLRVAVDIERRVDGGPWTRTGTGNRMATSADCVNVVAALAPDVLLPDIRIKDLNRCGIGDLNATGGSCFMILSPNPANEDFPKLAGVKFLKFPVITLNAGAGPAEVIAERSSTTGAWRAWQTFYRPDGARQSVIADNVEFYFAGDGHNHWHFRDFDSYWIESLDGVKLRMAAKHGYCVQDNTTWHGLSSQPNVPTNPVYVESTTCGTGLPNTLNLIQGLSRGWGDTYPTTLPDQGIDISGLPDGRYRVGVTADVIGAVTESNESNNTTSMEITITGNMVTTHPETATGGLR